MSQPLRCPACDHEFPAAEALPVSGQLNDEEAAEIARSGKNYLTERSQRGRRRPIARATGWLSIVVVLAAIVAVIYQAGAKNQQTPPTERVVIEFPEGNSGAPATTPKGSIAKPPAVPQPPAEIVAAADASPPPPTLAETIGRSVVILETEDAGGTTSLGSGFLVQAKPGESGRLVVITNCHVLSAATSAYARFRDGSRHAVEGYWAIDPEMDLAAIALASMPVDAAPLRFSDDVPRQGREVVAVGHPQAIHFSIFPGEVSRIVETRELPLSARNYLREMIRGEANLRWIQHTARLTEGNSGGPLLNANRQVVGINTWTNQETGFGYAVHEQHARSLLERPLAEVAPLGTYTSRQALAAQSRKQLTAERLEGLLAEAEAFGFTPQHGEHYRVLQELAVALTYAGRQGELATNSAMHQEREALRLAADRVASRLRGHRWNSFGATTIINEFALEEIHRDMAGVFAFAVAERVVVGKEGVRGALMRVAGSQQPIFVPLDGMLITPEADRHYLIVGMNFESQVVRYGDNPLALTEAPVIITASDGIVELE